ncbi:MAG: hypothetical protein KatS3mg109_0273 [Pirellulaceae bacterium]|nr:MAG: hypothetical protein KatS3mg109_0273 [Pirellulaceae bacterium]
MGTERSGAQLLLQEVECAEQLAARVEEYVRALDPQRGKLSELLDAVQELKSDLAGLRARVRQRPTVVVVPLSAFEERIARQVIEEVKNSWAGDARRAEAGVASEPPVRDHFLSGVHFVRPLNEAPLERDSLVDVVSSGVRIFVLEYGKQRDGIVLDFLRKGGGATLVVLLLSRRHAKEEAVSEVQRGWEKRGIAVDETSLVIQPIVVESDELKRDRDTSECVAQLVSNLQRCMSLSNRVVNVQPFIQAFLDKCSPLVSTIEQTVASDLERLREMEKALPKMLLDKMIPSEQHLAVDVRHRLRLKLFEITPLWCFPYRTLLGTMLLTAGAWDRLLLLPVSKVFGALKVGFQSAANLEALREMAARFQKSVIDQCQWEARKELQPIVNGIHLKLWKRFSSEEETEFHGDFPEDIITVRGLDAVWERLKDTVDQAIAQVSPSKRRVQVTGALATSLFATFMAGPLYAAYDAYLTAWFESLAHGNEKAWANYEAVGLSTFLVAFFYSIVPVFALALVAMSLVARDKSVKRAVDQIQACCHETLQEAQEGSLVRVDVRDRKVQAIVGLHRVMNEGTRFSP